MAEHFDLPVLPLRDTVVYPGVAVPISAGRPGTVEAVQTALNGERKLFAVAQRENVEEADPDILYRVGTVVRIVQTHRVRGGVQLLVQGEGRAEAAEYRTTGNKALEAGLQWLERLAPRDTEDPAFQALDQELRERAQELGTRRGVPAEALNQLIEGVDDPGSFADLVAFYLDLPTADKQKLLEVLDDEERMRRALVAVEKELARADAQEDIQARVQEELGERQREMLLREQLKQIRQELGEEDERSEIEELKNRISELELEEETREEVERELKRLERTSPQSAEYQVIRTFLEWVTELPWRTRTRDEIDLKRSAEILATDHYGLEDVKDRVLEFLAVRKLQLERFGAPEGADEEEEPGEAQEEVGAEVPGAGNGHGTGTNGNGHSHAAILSGADEEAEDDAPAAVTGEDQPEGDGGGAMPEGEEHHEDGPGQDDSDPDDGDESDEERTAGRSPILLFTGPPGVGKTSIARSIARSLGREYVRISLGGARDEADIRGHRRTYVGAMPGRIIQGMRQAGTKNPVFLLDEVDKLGVSFQGDPSAALLEVLDPAQNHKFTDHYLGVPFDLSDVLFVCTGNYADRIPAPLLDRMEQVEFSGYTEQEKLEIAKRYLLPRQREEAGIEEEELTLTDEAILEVVRKYTREAGVRQLERELGKVARKVTRKIAAGEVERMNVDADEVRRLLGRPRVHPEKMRMEDAVGVATGMFYTPNGGDIMFVEASVMPGDSGLVLTGQLGDVMKESGRAAWSYAKSRHEELGIGEEGLQGKEVHIHVPAGAIPKDGPSAGSTMAVALISVLTDREVRRDVALTGELTLTGRVIPVGGIKEKVLGAVRAGIHEIILPKENEADLEDIPDDVREQLTIHLVTNLDEVIPLALADGKGGSAGRKKKGEAEVAPV